MHLDMPPSPCCNSPASTESRRRPTFETSFLTTVSAPLHIVGSIKSEWGMVKLKVVVTGASGFIGTHVIEQWLDKGADIHALDLWRSEAMQTLIGTGQVTFHQGDLLDVDTLRRLLEDAEIVYHLGSILGTSESIELYDPVSVAETNVVGTARLLSAAKELGVRRVLYPSTPDVPWLNPYKITKQAAEKYCLLYHHEFGLETVVLRLTNVYGPRERWLEAAMGAPFNYQKVVPTFIVRALKGESLPVYGDGSQSAEYVYVTDVARAFYLAGNAPAREVAGQVIPIGTGQGVRVIDLARHIATLIGTSSTIQRLPMRRGEVYVTISVDPDVAHRKMGFKAQVELDEGLRRSIDYYKRVAV